MFKMTIGQLKDLINKYTDDTLVEMGEWGVHNNHYIDIMKTNDTQWVNIWNDEEEEDERPFEHDYIKDLDEIFKGIL